MGSPWAAASFSCPGVVSANRLQCGYLLQDASLWNAGDSLLTWSKQQQQDTNTKNVSVSVNVCVYLYRSPGSRRFPTEDFLQCLEHLLLFLTDHSQLLHSIFLYSLVSVLQSNTQLADGLSCGPSRLCWNWPCLTHAVCTEATPAAPTLLLHPCLFTKQ